MRALGIGFANLLLVAVAGFIGVCYSALITQFYERTSTGTDSLHAARNRAFTVGFCAFAAVALIHCITRREQWTPDPEEPQIYLDRRGFFQEENIPCKWVAYDQDADGKHFGWCAKDKSGHWYLFVDPYSHADADNDIGPP